MNLLEAVILGLVQGLTEFFPVSSSGHLVLAESMLGVNPPGVGFEVLVHVATLAAVLLVYRRRILALAIGGARGEPEALRYLGKLALASLPVALVGLTAASFIYRVFDAPAIAAGNLLITGAVVYATRWLIGRGDRREPGWSASIGIGLAQAVAILPGISRSGATVAAALGTRMAPAAAAEFAFLLSIPAILGAFALKAPELMSSDLGVSPLALAAASVSAFVSAVAAIVLFVRWLQAGHLHRFAYYCWAVGASYLVYSLMTP